MLSYKFRIREKRGELRLAKLCITFRGGNGRLCAGVCKNSEAGRRSRIFRRAWRRKNHLYQIYVRSAFALVHCYRAKFPVYHFDMYRISGFDDLYSTGFFDYLDAGGVLVIEWSENVLEFLPKDMIRVDIKRISDNEREITVKRGEEK